MCIRDRFYTGHLVDPQGPFGRMFRKLRIQGRMQIFEKMSQKALNRILTLPNYSTGPGLLISSGIIDLQNKSVCKQFKHWKFRISVPMSHISFWLYRAPWLQSASGRRQIQEKRNLRIQGRMQNFKKIPQKALNPILTLANYSTGPGLLISSGIIDLQNNGVCE